MNGRYLLLSCVVFFFASGCLPGSGGPAVADTTLVQVTMALHQLEARRVLGYPAPTGARDSVLRRHGLDEAQYERVLEYLKARPDSASSLYNAVADSLRVRSQQAGAAPPATTNPTPPVADTTGYFGR